MPRGGRGRSKSAEKGHCISSSERGTCGGNGRQRGILLGCSFAAAEEQKRAPGKQKDGRQINPKGAETLNPYVISPPSYTPSKIVHSDTPKWKNGKACSWPLNGRRAMWNTDGKATGSLY